MKKVIVYLMLAGVIFSGGQLSAQNTKTTSSSSKYKKSPLIYGPKSQTKIRELFFTKTGFKLSETIASINALAGYTGFEPIEGAGNIYTWDFTNGFQLSVISESGGKAGATDLISLTSFNYGGLNSFELGNTITLHKSTLSSLQKLYSGKLVKFENSNTYKIKDGAIYATFYFDSKNILTSLSISNYDLEI